LHATVAEEELSALGAATVYIFVFNSVSDFSGKTIFLCAAKRSSASHAVIARDSVFGDGLSTRVLQVASPLSVEIQAAQVVQVGNVEVLLELGLLALCEAVVVRCGLFGLHGDSFLCFDRSAEGQGAQVEAAA